MKVQIEESWQQRLQDEFDKPYFEKLVMFVKSEYKKAHVLPPGHQIFHVFNACPFEKVKLSSWDKIPILIRANITGYVFPYRMG